MKLVNALMKVTCVVIVTFTFLSCDDDFNSVGSEIIGDVNFEDDLYSTKPVAFSKKLERVQTAGLPNNLLGLYDDPVYGRSMYNILSTVNISEFEPEYGDNAVLDSIVFSLPYFSTATETETLEDVVVAIDSDGTQTTSSFTATTYELDSIYGSSPIKLSVYKSNYFLREFDPSSDQVQLYYSDDIDIYEPEAEETLLHTINSFVPSADELVTKVTTVNADNETTITRTRLSPRLRVKFSDETLDVFKTLFLDKEGGAEFVNSNNFRNYFRGIYLKAEAVNGVGSLINFDMSDASITLHWSYEGTDTSDIDEDDDTDEILTQQDNLTLSFSGTVVNSITTDLDAEIAEELEEENQDTVNGEENLYLKGGDGSYAVLDILNNTIINENGEEENELDYVRRQNWLVNDARLTFYIDKDKVTGGDSEPERIYIFNSETGSIMLDYSLDAQDSTDPIESITDHLGRISRDSDENGESYTIKITQYIINLLDDEDQENVKLGLVVSQNVNITATTVGDTPSNTDEIIPSASIISHEGTILYGNTEDVPESKRLTLDIFYTTSK
ncbi:DUF4270 domain-containing protein [Aquimarina pacifica]|uniref:DUF4270 domain-containing protein n=1 Tax=Aquimarina pacifica TaxID=1296415 RepID=UPI0004702CC7|nr:DUF4270 domain-containing protein [Aquimarina pacifica]